jgi:uncharacterized protein (TIGR00251 family)
VETINISAYKEMPCIEIKVLPGASTNAVLGVCQGALKIGLHAPPEKGKANQEMIRFLSKVLDIKKSDISIVRGEKARHKLVAFANCTKEEFSAKFKKIVV